MPVTADFEEFIDAHPQKKKKKDINQVNKNNLLRVTPTSAKETGVEIRRESKELCDKKARGKKKGQSDNVYPNTILVHKSNRA